MKTRNRFLRPYGKLAMIANRHVMDLRELNPLMLRCVLELCGCSQSVNILCKSRRKKVLRPIR